MNTLNLSDNIVRLRRGKKLTQEQLADFVGVTKASVSKWETKQSMPDVMLLPRLAAFFDVTIDELLGYEPQLSKEQIQKIYCGFASDFAQKPFEEIMEQSQTLVKRYYSCYPFLFQISCLWLNHYMLAKDEVRQMEILGMASELCQHIISDCKDIAVWNDTVFLKATIDLQLGKNREVIETLEEILNPYRLSGQSDGLMIRAYWQVNEREKADSYTQISMFTHLLSMISNAVWHMMNHGDDFAVCQETIRRIDSVIEVFRVEKLHPNTAAVYQYQAAIVYCMHGKNSEAIERLRRYTEAVRYMLKNNNLIFHGDEYFNLIRRWYEQSELGVHAPRDKKVILDNALQGLEQPVFAVLKEDREFLHLKKVLSEKGGSL